MDTTQEIKIGSSVRTTVSIPFGIIPPLESPNPAIPIGVIGEVKEVIALDKGFWARVEWDVDGKLHTCNVYPGEYEFVK